MNFLDFGIGGGTKFGS